MHYFFLEPDISVLMIRDSKHSPILVSPDKLQTRYLHQAHKSTNHSGVTRIRELLSSYWREFKKKHDIKAYVNSSDTCVKCKGNYSKRARWPIGHCKRGKRPFELVFIDFVQRQALHPHHPRQLQPTLYCHTIRKGPRNGRYPRTVPIFSPPQRNTSHSVLRSWHTLYWWGPQTILLPNVHYTGTPLFLVTAEFGKYWAARSHDEKYLLHAMRGQKLWMERRPRICYLIHKCLIYSATGVSPHYTIIGAHPNIGLPKLHKKKRLQTTIRELVACK